MKTIGLTGGIGSGKTTVAGFFKDLGIPVYIADEAGKIVMNSSAEVREKIMKLLGAGAYNANEPNRPYIASKVFPSKALLEKLNQIIHPAVEKNFNAWKKVQNAPYIIYEAAILFETGGYKKCDAVILVTAPLNTRISRLQERDKSSLEEIEARMANQWTDEQKLKLADFIIENTEISKTRDLVRNVHEILLKPSQN